MQIDRRRALALIGVSAATPSVAEASNPPRISFKHGVASGDPLQDRVIIWTRVSDTTVGVMLMWEVALDKGFKKIVAKGALRSGPENDFTYKVDVTGLKPGTEYFYRFRYGAPPWGDLLISRIGRTKTLPAGKTKDVVLAVASCTLYPNGYFNAYRAIADLPRVDAVVHLGDYIYEYGGPKSYGMSSPVADVRPHDPPHECLTLADYRRRHAQYKADADTQAAHARAAWITSWDDHETANNSYSEGAENHQPEEGRWADRKAAALKAYYEWMPIREPRKGQGHVEASARTFRFGDLAVLMMLETRLASRVKQLEEEDVQIVDGKPDVAAFNRRLNDPNRRMMGEWQERWLDRDLSASAFAGHTWQVIGNQVVMARVGRVTMETLKPDEQAALSAAAKRRLERGAPGAKLGIPPALDMWDGYPADRERLYGLMTAAKARPIVLSGDSHSFWANELHDAAGKRVACEFGTTGITSPGAGEFAPGRDYGELVGRVSPEVKYNNQVAKGFVLLTLTRAQAKAEMVAVSTIHSREFKSEVVKTFVVKPEGTGVSKLL